MKLKVEYGAKFYKHIKAYGHTAGCSWWAVFNPGSTGTAMIVIKPPAEIRTTRRWARSLPFRYPYHTYDCGRLFTVQSQVLGSLGSSPCPVHLQDLLYTTFSKGAAYNSCTGKWEPHYLVHRYWLKDGGVPDIYNHCNPIAAADMPDFCTRAAEYLSLQVKLAIDDPSRI